jgi:protein associated with RNAse G/E
MTNQTILDKAAQETANIINRLAQDDPTWNRFLTRTPAYRYFHIKGSENQYFWTTEPVKHNGHKRFVSGIYRFIKSKNQLKLTDERYHSKRKDAKARALALYNQAKEAK